MANTLYIEPFSGIAGDMMLSALCSLADAYDEILALPDTLQLPDAQVEIQTLDKNGIVCRHIKITDTGAAKGKADAHGHHHGSHHHHGPHRHLSDILALIGQAPLSERAKAIATEVFTLIGRSESRIHDIPLKKIHFHEVSGVDSIIDIVGCAALLDRLDIAETYCDPVCVGYGSVQTQHGLLPVPAPATADLLRGIPTFKGDEPGERCTPTGAALLKYLNPRFEPAPRPARDIAYGPGQKDFKGANVLRLSLLEAAGTAEAQRVWIVETNLDDMSPELLGSDFQEALLAAGALDFHFTPIQMKKGRPALQLAAMADDAARERVIDYILENTSTLGLRYYPAERRTLRRRKIEIETELGTVLAKEATKPSGALQTKFEHESLKTLAETHRISIAELKRRLNRD